MKISFLVSFMISFAFIYSVIRFIWDFGTLLGKRRVQSKKSKRPLDATKIMVLDNTKPMPKITDNLTQIVNEKFLKVCLTKQEIYNIHDVEQLRRVMTMMEQRLRTGSPTVDRIRAAAGLSPFDPRGY